MIKTIKDANMGFIGFSLIVGLLTISTYTYFSLKQTILEQNNIILCSIGLIFTLIFFLMGLYPNDKTTKTLLGLN